MKKKNCQKKCGSEPCGNKNKEIPNKTRFGALGNVEVLKVKENKDGSVTIDFECDDRFVEFYKSETGVKKATKAGLGKFIASLIEDKLDDKPDKE